jgi:hypothetical protein
MKKQRTFEEGASLVTVIGGCVAVLVASVLGMALGSWIFMLLWNAALVPLFGAPELSFWMSVALGILLSMVAAPFRRSK